MSSATHTPKPTALNWVLAGALILAVLLAFVGCTWPASSSVDKAAESHEVQQTQMVSIPVEGMTCAACVASVKRRAESLDGVRDAKVDLATRRARVEYSEGQTSPEQIVAAIEQLGYKTGTPVEEQGR